MELKEQGGKMDFLRLYLGEIVSLALALVIFFVAAVIASRHLTNRRINPKRPQFLHRRRYRSLRFLLDLLGSGQPDPTGPDRSLRRGSGPKGFRAAAFRSEEIREEHYENEALSAITDNLALRLRRPRRAIYSRRIHGQGAHAHRLGAIHA